MTTEQALKISRKTLHRAALKTSIDSSETINYYLNSALIHSTCIHYILQIK